MRQTSDRSGQYVAQPTGYRAFVPKPLPPNPPIQIDDEMQELLSKADRALGRLDGSAQALPDSDLFTLMYVRKEAVLSSQIEGTQASLSEVLELEAKVQNPHRPSDVADVVNYVAALKYGLKRLNELPLSLRLIREIHEALLMDTRGETQSPGEFRRSQNWIGPEGSTLKTASFVPPAVDDMKKSLGDLEEFLHDDSIHMPILIRVGLAHAQFETIHPFLDGNGRIGRLLITFLLCQKDILRQPLLYLSYFFKQNRTEYYDRLQAVRDRGDWEGWIKFFLRGVAQVANEATEIARKIITLRESDRSLVLEKYSSGDALRLHELLFTNPIVSIPYVAEKLSVSFPSASRHVVKLERLGLLHEITGRPRNRVYSYYRYVELFVDDEVTTPPS